MSKKNLELSVLDKAVRYVSPTAFNRRMVAKINSELLMLRQFDAAYNNPQNKIKSNQNSANNEISKALAPIRNNVRELLRNNSFAKKSVEVIVNGVVGWGIEANLKHEDDDRLAIIKAEWDVWSGGLCSFDGKTNFLGMQQQVMATVVGDGEILGRELALDGALRIKLLESDYIADGVKAPVGANERFVNGIVLDQYGRKTKFNLYNFHPGSGTGKPTASLVPANEIIHVYRRDRVEQDRGVSWLAPIVQPLNMLAELQWTHLMKMKLASSITAIVTEGGPSNLSPELLQERRQRDWNVNPGDVKFMPNTDKVEFPAIPNTEGFEASTKLSLKEAASGIGIMYPHLGQDYAEINFSSGKIGEVQQKTNFEQWRWHVIIPGFCEPAFAVFKKHCAIKGINTDGLLVEWVPPQYQALDIAGETNATVTQIRAGLTTLPEVLREKGRDPIAHLEEIAEFNKKLDELGLILDTDPRRISNQQLQSPDSLNGIKADQKSQATVKV